MDRKGLPKVFKIQISIYLITVLLLSVILIILNLTAGIIGLSAFFILLVFYIGSSMKRQKDIVKYLEDLTFNIDAATKDTLLNFPMPLVVSELDGDIIWYNSSLKAMFNNNKQLEKSIKEFSKDLGDMGEKKDLVKICRPVTINGTDHYNMYGNIIKLQDEEIEGYLVLLYFVDINEYIKLKNTYDENDNVTGIIVIDNYDDLMESIQDENRTNLLAEINNKVNESLGFTNAIIRKFERDKYLFVLQKKYLGILTNKNFDILDSVKLIDIGNKIPVTLSIGFGKSGESPNDNFNYARRSVDMALGRGGDQVVINDGESFRYFGGKTMEVEKRTKVKARVIAMALKEMIDQASNVIIMGHRNPDPDAVGAAMGLSRAVRNRGKTPYFIINKPNINVIRLLERINQDKEYKGFFIPENQAAEIIDNKTLLIVVDTYRRSLVEAPSILELAKQKVVFDHHRKGEDFIDDAIISYHETYASSTCELVTEVLLYMENKMKMKDVEAEAMLAGIIVDTKNFTFKVGVRTFEAAAFIRRQGIDTTVVKKLLQNSKEVYEGLAEVVNKAEIIEGFVAISDYRKVSENSVLIAAKASDELLNIEDVEASFVLCYGNENIYISGRSYGRINVQMIMEKLGGGGHFSVAAAQLEVPTIEEACEILKSKIAEYFRETNYKPGV
jgi:c-di-AMP phosphodiesterase-like protein